MILYFLFGIFAGQLGLNHTLYYFGSGSGAPYSDMNGYAQVKEAPERKKLSLKGFK